MICNSCKLAEVLSHGNYWFNYLRFCCDSTTVAESNQIGTLKWLSLLVSFDLKAYAETMPFHKTSTPGN